MRIYIDLPGEDVALLDKLAEAGNTSRAELIRKAVIAYLASHKQTSISEFSGMWRDFPEDGQAYQDRLRNEWER